PGRRAASAPSRDRLVLVRLAGGPSGQRARGALGDAAKLPGPASRGGERGARDPARPAARGGGVEGPLRADAAGRRVRGPDLHALAGGLPDPRALPALAAGARLLLHVLPVRAAPGSQRLPLRGRRLEAEPRMADVRALAPHDERDARGAVLPPAAPPSLHGRGRRRGDEREAPRLEGAAARAEVSLHAAQDRAPAG